MPDQQTLAQMVRAKYPGAYDDLSDAQLEQSVKAKFPGVYDDVPTTKEQPKASATNQRGFFSAAGDMVKGIPGMVATGAEEFARQLIPNNPLLEGRHAVRQFQQGEDVLQGVQKHGVPAEVVHQVGQAVGIPSHDIVQDYQDKNFSALAGDVVAPLAASAAVHAAIEHGPAMVDQMAAKRVASQAAKADINHVSSLMQAIPPSASTPYDLSNIKRAQPYLQAEHATQPIDSVQRFVEASDAAIGKIENKVSSYVQAHPNDLILSDPLAAAKAELMKNPRGAAVDKGMKALSDLGLDQYKTIESADAIRQQLNAENKAFMDKNNYDRATARKVDPKFAAREAAANALRDGIYGRLERNGFEDARKLRQDEGSIIRLRDAAQAKIFSGDKSVSGTGNNSIPRQIAAETARLGSVAAGGAGFGVPGAVTGAVIGDRIANAIRQPNLTRDALILKAFGGGR